MIFPVVQVLAAFTLWTSLASAQEEEAMDNGDVHCLTVHEDLMRRQRDEWGSEGPFDIDDGTKHTPFLSFNASSRQATVVVGNGDDVGGVFHPMVASDNPTTVHFITHIYVVDQNEDVFAFSTMDPTQPAPATFVFDVPESVTQMMAFEFCNLHGLWSGPSVSTLAENITTAEEKAGDSDVADYVGMCEVESPVPVAFDSFDADFVRRQSLPPFNSPEPYDQADGDKHVPFIQLHKNGTATVTVGVEGNYHIMLGSSRELNEQGNPVEPHWITDVYVVDQNGTILTMESLNPADMEVAQIHFTVPSNATTLTAFEWCNIHGLYVGPTIDAVTGEVLQALSGGDSNSGKVEPMESSASRPLGNMRANTGIGAIVAAAALLF